MMKIKEKRNHRFKRNIDEGMICPANSQVTSCCRYAMVIDFEEIGWDWIIAPRSYAANYCQGECPRMYLLEYAHTHILESVGTHPFGGTGPCCAPRQMSDLPMLHTDTNENIQFTTIAAMKVDSCHCAWVLHLVRPVDNDKTTNQMIRTNLSLKMTYAHQCYLFEGLNCADVKSRNRDVE